MNQKVKGFPAQLTAHTAAAAVEEMTALSSGRDPTLGPFSHPECGSSSEGLRGSRPRVPAHSASGYRPSCGAGLPAHRSCHLRPPWRLPCTSLARAGGV